MPYLRYKFWESDGVSARKALVSNREYVFLDSEQGVCQVPHRDHATQLLRHVSNNYEVAWEHYGVRFDAAGQEMMPKPGETAGEASQATNTPPVPLTKRKPGRPKKR